jgi:2-polyprenyl-6-methoxyphenol hydroxylase-like FAD-dependent oxidoreductase
MLLARRGYRVLLLEKGSFPSDTISTHIIWPHGAEALERWGLYNRVAETNCPSIGLNMIFDVGPFALEGGVHDTNDGRGGLCPRRTVLDELLAHAAVESGAELREEFTVDSLLWQDDNVVGIRGHARGGDVVEERANIVIGADGVHSFVAKSVKPAEYDTAPELVCFFYSYFSGVEVYDVEQYIGLPNSGAAYFPTNDGLCLVAGAWQSKRFHEIRADIEGNVMGLHNQVPKLAERLSRAKREEKWYGTVGVPNYLRRPFGPGWALVGDAGHCKDPLTGQGINDAFLDSESLAMAIDDGLAGRHPIAEALAAYERRRNERVTPLYHFTRELAQLEPPPPEMQRLFGAMHRNQEATDRFFSAITGSLPLPVFMDPQNIDRILAVASAEV